MHLGVSSLRLFFKLDFSGYNYKQDDPENEKQKKLKNVIIAHLI